MDSRLLIVSNRLPVTARLEAGSVRLRQRMVAWRPASDLGTSGAAGSGSGGPAMSRTSQRSRPRISTCNLPSVAWSPCICLATWY